MPPLQQSYKVNCFCLTVIPVPDHSKEYQCLIPTPKILISVPVTKYRECDFSFLFPSPYKPGGRGAMCPSWLPYSTDSYLHILVFVFVSCVSQFAKFCKLWARQRRQVFLCVTICKILQIVDQTTTTRFPFLAVQNSSIGDLVPWSVGWSDQTNDQSLHNITEWS